MKIVQRFSAQGVHKTQDCNGLEVIDNSGTVGNCGCFELQGVTCRVVAGFHNRAVLPQTGHGDVGR